MKTMLSTLSALAALALCTSAAHAETCGPRAHQGIRELEQAKATLSHVLPAHASAASRRTFNSNVMQPLQKAIRWIENNCREQPARQTRSGRGRASSIRQQEGR